MQVVMGIDPGAANLGFGIVRVEGNHMVALDGGVVETTPDLPMEQRLERIHRTLAELIAWHEPKAMAIEEVYFGKNVRSAMAVGQACGVAMLAAAERGVGCFAYAARTARAAVAGPRRRRARRRDLPRRHQRSPQRRRRLRWSERFERGAARRMIAAVRGEVMVRRADHVVIDAGGVGYRLAVSAETLKAVPATGRDAFLHAELIARDDSLALYGFSSEEERDLFRLLITVSGVGPKVAIATLSGGTARDLLRAIAAGDAKRFQAVPGIGKRTAERIIVELREKVAGTLEEEVALGGAEEGDARVLARDGLVNLGYAPLEAEQLLDGVEGSEPQELVAAALRKAAASRNAA
jgi:Holliday junction DNA helicase RuvA